MSEDGLNEADDAYAHPTIPQSDLIQASIEPNGCLDVRIGDFVNIASFLVDFRGRGSRGWRCRRCSGQPQGSKAGQIGDEVQCVDDELYKELS